MRSLLAPNQTLNPTLTLADGPICDVRVRVSCIVYLSILSAIFLGEVWFGFICLVLVFLCPSCSALCDYVTDVHPIFSTISPTNHAPYYRGYRGYQSIDAVLILLGTIYIAWHG